MKKIMILVVSCIFLISFNLLGSNQTIIGTIDASGIVTFSVDKTILMQAFEDELNDGSDIDDVKIKQDDNGDWFLVGFGTNGQKKLSAYLTLNIDSNNNFTIALIPANANLTICSTTNCFDVAGHGLCDWSTCYCKPSSGGQCYEGHKLVDNGIGYLGNFY